MPKGFISLCVAFTEKNIFKSSLIFLRLEKSLWSLTNASVATGVADLGLLRVLPRALGYGDILRSVRVSPNRESSHIVIENGDSGPVVGRGSHTLFDKLDMGAGKFRKS